MTLREAKCLPFFCPIGYDMGSNHSSKHVKFRHTEVEIHKIAKDGKGLGSFIDDAGKTQDIEVPFCMPQDKVKAAYKKKRRGIFSGSLLHVIQPANERISPRCVHFCSCGGCS